jgi:hypothetical protein
MPRIDVLLFRDDDGSVPVLKWLDELEERAVVKCRVRIERLRELGHELRRPEADYLRDGIYELRISLRGIQYRLLYFFHGRTAVVLSHGLVKERAVPGREIDKAVQRSLRFKKDPERHTAGEW